MLAAGSSLRCAFSQAITYGVFTFANFFAPPIAVRLGSKWSMFIASLAYAVFEGSFLFLHEAVLYACSVLVGMAAARKDFFILTAKIRSECFHLQLFLAQRKIFIFGS